MGTVLGPGPRTVPNLRIMIFIYDLIYLILLVFYLPVYIFRGKFHKGFAQRLGFLPGRSDLHGPVWIHAVSVGEVMVIKGLLERLRQAYPDKKFVISTVTPTGHKIAQGLVREEDLLIYLPLDFSFIIRRAIRRLLPCVFILAETEIWPNLISSLARYNIPVATVNGRISDSSLRGYSLARFFFSPILKKVALFCVQSPTDAARFASLGVGEKRIQVTGNMKFDIKAAPTARLSATECRKKLKVGDKETLLVCGSTHPGEEELLVDIYARLLHTFAHLRLILAPRHPARAGEIEKLILHKGFSAQRFSLLAESTILGKKTVFIVDTIGLLMQFYAAADLVFVGGSLVKKGGHNILEPASLGKPVIFGPHTFNFSDITDLFLKNEAALMAKDAAQLESGISRIISDPQASSRMSAKAIELYLSNQGATEKSFSLIKTLI